MLPLGIGGRDVHVTPIIAIDNGDDLIEEYSGFAPALRNAEARHGTARRVLRVVDVRPDLARPHAGGARVRIRALRAPYRNRMSGDAAREVRDHAAAQRRRRRAASPSWIRCWSRCWIRWRLPTRRWRTPAIGFGAVTPQRSRPGAGPRHDVEAAVTVRAGTEALSKATSSTSATSGRPITRSAGRSTRCACRAWRAASTATRRSSNGSRSAIRGRFAAGTSTTSRRPAATGCSIRRWNTGIADWGCSSTPAPSGTHGTERRVRVVDRRGLQPRSGVLHAGLPGEHRRVPRGVHDGLPVLGSVGRHQEVLT